MPGKVERVTVRWGRVANDRIMLRYRVDGCEQLVVPRPGLAERADGLWQRTCCELFLATGGGTYREYNFSPSGEWAAYAFAGYRSRTAEYAPAAVPDIAVDSGRSVFTQTVFLPAAELDGATHAVLSAVIEEERGRKSYWAPRHPGLKPDFHNPASFVLPIP